MVIRYIILFYICELVNATEDKNSKDNNMLTIIENTFIYKIGDITNYLTKTLEKYNDKNLGSSEWGKMLGYNELKPKLLDERHERGFKKMSMAMMPLIFHVGATSTWMLITSIMAAKSVAIGLLLLVFKIAVSSAKVASFFTLLKSKHSDHHQSWAWSPPHGHDRSFSHSDIPGHEEWSSYNPEWSPSEQSSFPGYKTIPTFKENAISSYDEELEYEESMPPMADKKYGFI